MSYYSLIDTHAHLFWETFQSDLDSVLNRALSENVSTFINVGVDVHLSAKAARMETDKGKFYSSIGIHPEEAIKYFASNPQADLETDINALEKIYQEYPDKVVAVGECGLDFTYLKRESYLPDNISFTQAKDLQIMLFQAQINLAKKLRLPLLLHVRDDRSENPELIDCWDRVLEMAGDHFGILHCYSGLEKTTKRVLALKGWLVSFAGNLTYKKNDYLKEAVKQLPLEKICLETDCPFLPPQSIRGKRNEPSSVKEIAAVIAQLKGTSLENVAESTTENVRNLLNLSQ